MKQLQSMGGRFHITVVDNPDDVHPLSAELIANGAAGNHRQNCESIAMGLGFSLMGSMILYL